MEVYFVSPIKPKRMPSKIKSSGFFSRLIFSAIKMSRKTNNSKSESGNSIRPNSIEHKGTI